MEFYVVSEKKEFLSSSQNCILPRNTFFNLAVYTDLESAYREAIGYFNAIRIAEENEDTGLENYCSKVIKKHELEMELHSQKSDGVSSQIVVATETSTGYSPADSKIWTKEVTSVLLQVFSEDMCLY